MSGGATILPPRVTGWPPDPLTQPHYYFGVTLRRVVAFGLDWAILVMVLLVLHLMVGMLTLLSFGLLWPLHLLVLPLFVALAYHIAQIASSSAGTIGMRLFGLRAWSVTGGRPTGFQAVLHGVCLYGSMAATGGLIMLVALFNQRHQTLHDMLAGIVVLRET